MPSRVYFLDAITNEEISCEWNGWFPAAFDSCGAGPASSVLYTDTTWSVTVKPGPYKGSARTITAADFPGRVVKVKDWRSGITAPGADYRLLISREMGFVSLSEVTPRGEMRRVDGVSYRDHHRAEILGDRNALRWIARRIIGARLTSHGAAS